MATKTQKQAGRRTSLREEKLPDASGIPVYCAFRELRDEEKALVHEHVRRFFKWLDTKKYKVHVRVFMSRYRGYTRCPDCGGSRLRPEALYSPIVS